MAENEAEQLPGELEQGGQLNAREVLRKNFLFASLTDEEIDSLVASIRTAHYDAGASIVRAGDAANELYLVLYGGVNVVSQGQFLAYLGRGGFFGEMALFTEGQKRSADCVSAVFTTCAVIEKGVLQGFCDASPTTGLKIYRSIIKALAERLQATSADLAMLMSAQVKSQTQVSELVEAQKNKKTT